MRKERKGNVPTLRYTDQKGAYTVIDRATYLSLKNQIKLVILVEGDEALLNFMSLIPVNPKKFPKVNYEDAMVFVKWLTLPEKGQKIIRDFGKDKYGSSPLLSELEGMESLTRSKELISLRRKNHETDFQHRHRFLFNR